MDKKIDSIAFELFRQWTKNVATDYPDLDFRIVDERILVTDVEKALESALNSLLTTKKAEKRSMLGYDYGFVIGFMQGKLNTHWCFEYITKRSKEFKSFLINKALFEYLQFETITAIRVKAVYEKMYEEALNLESLDYRLPQKRIEDYNIAQLQDNNFLDKEDNPVMVLLKNQISEQLLHLLKIETKVYLSDLNIFLIGNTWRINPQ